MGRRLIWDIETDALLLRCTRMWLFMALDVDTLEYFEYDEGDLGWQALLEETDEIIGHNIAGFDELALEKLFGYKFPKHIKKTDTLILSQVLNYRRFGDSGHSLAAWGEYLGFPKLEFKDFSTFVPEMREYGRRDIDLTKLVYEHLHREYKALAAKAPKLDPYLASEYAVSRWCGLAHWKGWPFDLEGALRLQSTLRIELERITLMLEPLLGWKAVAVDKVNGVVAVKEPKWTKQGAYNHHLANWFNIDPWSGYLGEERLVEGPYCRVEFEKLSLGSVSDVKMFLYRHGWVPTEWNWKKLDDGSKIKSSPKITEDSLELLGGDGKLYADFTTIRARLAILNGWIENTDSDGMLHGDCIVIGTPSMRARHSIIVNVPGAEAPWGKEMRMLFKSKPGWKLIGCDSSGNQARGLAHYLADPTFIDILLNGDIHSYNAEKLTQVLAEMRIDFKVPRAAAKRILYAFLFGASGEKLWSYVFGVIDKNNGNKLKAGFLAAVPGFKKLLDRLKEIYKKTSKYGEGYIPSIAGTRVYVDSQHKLLVYLLQSMEKATCGAAVMLTMQWLEERNIPYQPCIMMHDEEDFLVPEEFAEEAAALGKLAFKEGPKLFGVTIMDGDAKIGDNWYDVH